jgi:hypothetical protein
MGYYRDDQPLRELILDPKQTAELETLWREFDFIADHTIRTYTQYYFNQSGEILGNGRESGSERPADRPITHPSILQGLQEKYMAKARAHDSNDPLALQAIPAHFAFVNAAIRAIEKARADAEPRHLDALLDFARRAYRRPLTAAERTDLLAYYRQMREKTGLTHEEAIRDSVVGILLGFEKSDPAGYGTGNSRNGKTRKTLKSEQGELEVALPRDRKETFEPQLVRKQQRRWDGLDEKLIALYTRGMTVRDIQAQL